MYCSNAQYEASFIVTDATAKSDTAKHKKAICSMSNALSFYEI